MFNQAGGVTSAGRATLPVGAAKPGPTRRWVSTPWPGHGHFRGPGWWIPSVANSVVANGGRRSLISARQKAHRHPMLTVERVAALAGTRGTSWRTFRQPQGPVDGPETQYERPVATLADI